MKPFIACLFYFLVCPTQVIGQHLSFTSFYDEVDTYVRHHSPADALDHVDKLLYRYPDALSQQTLKTAKLFPLLQAEMYDACLQVSKDLLSDPQLPENFKIIAHLRRSLVFEILEIFDKSKNELDMAAEILSKQNFKKSELRAELMYRYGSLYRIEDKDSLAMAYVDRSIAFSKANNHSDALAVANMLKGFLTPDDAPETTTYYYNEALKNYKTHEDSLGISAMYFNLGRLNNEHANLDKALTYSDSAIIYSKPYPYFFALNGAFELKSKIYKKQKKLDSALVNFEKYHELEQQMSQDKQGLKVRELEYKFLLEKEQINKGQVEKDNIEMSAFNTKLMLLIYSLITFSVVLVILTILIIRRNRTIRVNRHKISKNNSQLQLNIKEKELLLKELNHRVKNNLSLILSLINFQGQEVQDPFYKSKFIELQHRIEAIAIVHEQMMPSNNNNQLDDAHNVNDYVQKIAQSLISLDVRDIHFEVDIAEIIVTLDVAVPIGILVNELISNSIKHAIFEDRLLINLAITSEENLLFIHYSDNGTHFKSTKNTSSLGLLIIDSMIKQLKGEYERTESTYAIQIQKHKHLDT